MWRSATLPAGPSLARVEHRDPVAQALRGHAEHPAELAAAQQPEPGAGGNDRTHAEPHAAGGTRIARAAFVCFSRNAASFLATAGSVAAIIATANRPAFAAPASPIANVATGMPLGIWTIESSESSPRRYFDGTGTPSTGHGRLGREHPGQVRGAAGAGDDAAQAARAGVLGVLEHVVGHPVRRHHARLVGDAERVELRGGMAHDVPVAVAAHHDADQRRALALCHRSSPMSDGIARATARESGLSANFSIRSGRRRAFAATVVAARSPDKRSRCRLPRACPVADNAGHVANPCRRRRCVRAASSCGAAAPAAAQSDADFLAARAAFERGDRRPARRARAEARGHVLAPYVEYWQLKLRLDSAPATTRSGDSSRAGRRRRSPTGCASNG